MPEGWHGPPWARGGWSGPPSRGWGPSRHIFRRAVGIVVFLILMGAVVGAVVATGIAAADGTRLWLVTIITVVVLVGFGLLARTMFRRTWRPVGELIDATRRVGDGETGVRLNFTQPGPLSAVARSFNRMAQRLEQDDERRSRLLADLSHELKTPMTVIRGEVEAVLDGVHPDSGLSNVLDEIDLMDRLLADLRVLADAEAGSLQLSPEPTNIAELAAEVVASFSRRAESQRVEVELSGPTEPVTALVDPHRIHQVFANLVSNALDAMPDGGSLKVSFSAHPDVVVINIDDTGPGVPVEDRETIFSRFVRASDSTGAGLGLSISRDLAVAHGGTLEATDAPEVGARFVLKLPRHGR